MGGSDDLFGLTSGSFICLVASARQGVCDT